MTFFILNAKYLAITPWLYDTDVSYDLRQEENKLISKVNDFFLRNNVCLCWTCQSNGLKENDWFKNTEQMCFVDYAQIDI